MKRVYCLYRVSSKKQVDHDDIPMQKLAAHEFVEKREDWTISKEFYEKGVSGFKVSAEKRDIIQSIKADAEKKLFDVLLVFMFDRLGRRDEETPFILQWFVLQGIEVWSILEGQQKFDDHIDKLLNYIRFWQASGESIKTSARIKTRLSQMVDEGQFRGGVPPYGYVLKENGKLSKKDTPLHILSIDEATSPCVVELFSKMCHEGYGTHRLAKLLNTKYPKTGSMWRASSINRIIKNPIYKGDIRHNDKTIHHEELRIVSNEQFSMANYILTQRSSANRNSREVPQQTNGAHLLTGLLYCAQCGQRLAGSTVKDNRVSRKGEVKPRERIVYRCFDHGRLSTKCPGQTVYSAKRLDESVLRIVQEIFAKINAQPPDVMLSNVFRDEKRAALRRLEDARCEVMKLERQDRNIRNEILKVINGDTVIDMKILQDLLIETERSLVIARGRRQEEESLYANINQHQHIISEQQQQFQGWGIEFQQASISVQKMILCNIIKKITVDSGYRITLDLNITAKQFLDGL